MFCNRIEIVYFDSFGVEHVPEEIQKFVGNKNISRVQTNDSIMCEYFCTGFIDLMLAGRKLTDYTSLFSPYDFKKNDNIILSYFKENQNTMAKKQKRTLQKKKKKNTKYFLKVKRMFLLLKILLAI